MAKNSKLPGWPDMLQPPFANLAAGFGQGASGSASPGPAADFVKVLWGGLPSSVPGFVLPTLDIAELDKRIEDLRSVESWLALNANMLKATIQGLEVQRNTLAALKALREKGDLLGAMMRPGAGQASDQAAPTSHLFASPTAAPEAAQSKSAFADAFSQSFGAGLSNPNWPLPLDASQPAPPDAVQPSDDDAPPYVAPRIKKSTRKKASKARARAAASQMAPLDAAGISSSAAQSANLWMNFLKDQFGQIASAALVAKHPASAKKVLGSKVAQPAKSVPKMAARAPAGRPAKTASVRARGSPKGTAKPPARRRLAGTKG